MQPRGGHGGRRHSRASTMWQAAAVAPRNQDIEVAVIDRDGEHRVVGPCRRIGDGWIDAASRRRLDISPTHWRPWPADSTDAH